MHRGDAQRCRARADAPLRYFLQVFAVLWLLFLGHFAELAACKALASSQAISFTRSAVAICLFASTRTSLTAMRTRSVTAKLRPQLLSLPTDLLPSIGAFTSDVDAALLAISSKRARSTLTHAVWSAILRSNHGGLRIAAGDDGLRVARHLWGVRGHSSDPVSPDPSIDGFFALATNCAPAPYAAQSYWADGLFRREAWRMYCTKETGGAPVVAVAAFLAIGDSSEEPIRG